MDQASNWKYADGISKILEKVFENLDDSKVRTEGVVLKNHPTPQHPFALSSPSLIRALGEWNQLPAKAPRQAARHLQCYPW